MRCVVCERPATIVKLVTVSHNKVCSSCKTAYYRGLTKLFEYVHHRNINPDSPTDCEQVVWEYLNDHKPCLRQLVFKRSNLCNLQSSNKPKCHVPCTHCRFRKMVITIKSLAMNRCSKVNIGVSTALSVNSLRIIKFCLRMLDGVEIRQGSDMMLTSPPFRNAVVKTVMKTEMKTEMQSGMQSGVRSDMRSGLQANMQPNMHPNMQTSMQIDMQTSMQTSMQTDMQTDTKTETSTSNTYNPETTTQIVPINQNTSPISQISQNTNFTVTPKIEVSINYRALTNWCPTTSIWSFLDIFRIIVGQKMLIFKISFPARPTGSFYGAILKISIFLF